METHYAPLWPKVHRKERDRAVPWCTSLGALEKWFKALLFNVHTNVGGEKLPGFDLGK